MVMVSNELKGTKDGSGISLDKHFKQLIYTHIKRTISQRVTTPNNQTFGQRRTM